MQSAGTRNRPAIDRRAAWQVAAFVAAILGVWSVRVTHLYSIDESIRSPLARAVYSSVLQVLLWGVPAAAFARLAQGTSAAVYLGLTTWPGLRSWLRCIAAIGVFLSIVAVVELMIGRKSISTSAMISLPIALWLLQLCLSPLIEEILFRGLMLKEFMTLAPAVVAVTLNSLLFVAIHLPYWLTQGGADGQLAANSVGVFAFSLVAGGLYAKTGSIWPPTVAHIANNVLSMLLVVGNG